jgi:hypothetical protein
MQDLQQAAVQGDTDRLVDLIAYIRERYPPLAERLLQLANDFQFEQIVRVTRAAPSHDTHMREERLSHDHTE